MRNDEVTEGESRRKAFATWLTALQPDLRRRAVRLTGSAVDGADLAQATNLRALEKRTLFVSGTAVELKRWLFRMMMNLHCDIVRRGSREAPADWLDEMPAAERPSRPAWTALADEEVATAVDGLSPPLREAYRLFAVDRVSYAAISARLGIPVSTVATRILRARGHLLATLTGEKTRRRTKRRVAVAPPVRPGATARNPALTPDVDDRPRALAVRSRSADVPATTTDPLQAVARRDRSGRRLGAADRRPSESAAPPG